MKVMLATPAYRGLVCPQFIDSLEETVNFFTLNGIDSVFKMVGGCCYIQIARNKIVKEFIDSDCDKLLFLDDDISWNASDAYKLVMQKMDIIAGIYPIKSEKEYYPVVLHCDENDYPVSEGNFLLASRVPTGFLCITRDAIEKIKASIPHLRYDEMELGDETLTKTEYYDFFPQGVKNGRWVGEDHAFCALWEEIGGKIYVPPDINFKHYSDSKTYEGNLWEFLKRQPGGVDYEDAKKTTHVT